MIGLIDEAPHADAQTEWWHVHADLVETGSADPRELHVFAAFIVERTKGESIAGIPVSMVAPRFHTALVQLQTDDGAWSADRHAFPDVWTASERDLDGERPLEVRHGDWRLAWDQGALVLSVGAGPDAIDVVFTETRPATLPGADGLVTLRSDSPHHWIQREQLSARGRWKDHGKTRFVEGTGFYKHQWGRLYDALVDGFSWVSLDLPDTRSLSFASLVVDDRWNQPGSIAFASSPEGTHPIDGWTLTPTTWWRSPRSGARWPASLHLVAPGVDLIVTPLARDQELWAFPTPVHVGPALALGTVDGVPFAGPAFLEQVGMAKPFFRFLYRSREVTP